MPTSPPLDSPAARRPSVTGSRGQPRRRPSNRGRHFPADPPRPEEIIAVMRCCEDSEHGARARALIVTPGRAGLRRLAARAGVRRRFAPHQLRHAHAIELAHKGVPLNVIQRQLGHRNLGVTLIYLQGIDPDEIIQTVHARRAPMIPASVGLALPHRL